MTVRPIPHAALDAITQVAEPTSLVAPDDHAPFLEEWRGRWPGETAMILAPASTAELSRIMAVAYAHNVPIVPQGGNTGLVGGQIPHHGEVLISTKRLRTVRDLSPEDFTITVEAGLSLAEVQDAAQSVGRLFPLSIGSEGTCQVGGVLSTNAGGVQVLRYGNARDLVLGIEAVLPDGRIWNGLNRLRKNNTGYDLKHLFVGGEGTLGIITAAVLKLFPRPKEQVTCFLALPSAEAAVSLLSRCQEQSGGQLTAFELMGGACIDLILDAFPALPRPVETRSPFGCLIEFSSGSDGQLTGVAEQILAAAMDDGEVVDGAIAQSKSQADHLWAIRHNASAAMKQDPSFCVKCDVSVPVGAVPAFLKAADFAVTKHTPGARIIAFGHMGDGNIHYDILGPVGMSRPTFEAAAPELERAVHDVVVAHDGSISAEHGIGILKRDELAEREDPVAQGLKQAIKAALDPKGLLNPGKLLGETPREHSPAPSCNDK